MSTINIFNELGFESRGVTNITPTKALKILKDDAILIDIRENYHSFLHAFDVKHLYYCPNSELSDNLDRIPRDRPVIIADSAGLKSMEAVQMLKEKGFSNVANLAGGMLEWNKEQLPVKSDKAQRISGSCMCMLKYREVKKTELPDIDPDKKI